MISPELLEMFDQPNDPMAIFPTCPVTVGNMLCESVRLGWLASAIPFGRQLRGPESIWKESLVLTLEGRKALGQ